MGREIFQEKKIGNNFHWLEDYNNQVLKDM